MILKIMMSNFDDANGFDESMTGDWRGAARSGAPASLLSGCCAGKEITLVFTRGMLNVVYILNSLCLSSATELSSK